MSMLNNRLQILVSSEQRLRLEAEAKRRGSSVATLVREAIDARFSSPTAEDRRGALQAVGAMHGRYLSPQELETVVDDERDQSATVTADG